MKAISIHGKTAGEIQTALQHSMADGFTPTLAIVFISIKQDRKTLCQVLQAQGIDIIALLHPAGLSMVTKHREKRLFFCWT